MKELIARSHLEHCLVLAPGSLVEQWQNELGQKFNLELDILTRDMIETSRSGNPFSERALGNEPIDVSAQKVGHDNASYDPKSGICALSNLRAASAPPTV